MKRPSALSAVGVDTASRWGATAHFFVYDVLKITVLLCVLIFGISYVQSYFRHDSRRRSAARQRRPARHHSCLHDGGDDIVASIARHAQKGRQAPSARLGLSQMPGV